MSPNISDGFTQKSNPAYHIIIDALKSNLQTAKSAPSQWRVKQNTNCGAGCPARLKLAAHRFDESMDVYMQTTYMYPFANPRGGKLYPVKGFVSGLEYVKAETILGYSVAEDRSSLGGGVMACYALKDESDKTLEYISDSQDTPSTPINGYVEVSVVWEDADIDMDLRVNFPGGTHDIQDECQLMEHFYALNDKEVTPGLYPVYITYSVDKEVNLSQKELQNIVVTIKVPGTTEARTVNLKTIDSLPGRGHIADIKVEQRKVELVLRDEYRKSSTVLYNRPEGGYASSESNGGGGGGGGGYSGGYGGGGGGGSGGWGYSYSPPPVSNDYIYSIIWHISQVLLGPLAGANISVYALEDYDLTKGEGKNPVYSGVSSYGSSIHTAGVINIPREIMDALDDEKIYVIEAKGGMDIDVNDDRVVDSSPVINLGAIRALSSGNVLKNVGFKVNILTEMAYQISKQRYDKNDLSKLASKSDEAVKCLLKSDINLDGIINTIDALYFTPYSDKGKLYANYNNEFMPIVNKIHRGGDIYQDSFNIYARPLVKGGYFSVNESAAVGASIGRIETDCVSESPVHSFTLSGDGSGRFEVDNAGNIKIAKKLVYEQQRIYNLRVIGVNAYGSSPGENVYITVTADNSPIITSSLTSFVHENTPNGSSLGRIAINDMGYPVTSVSLEGFGAEYFKVDNSGEVTVTQGHKIKAGDKTYSLMASAANAFGFSAPSPITLTVYDDAPVILNDIYATIRENIAVGASVAKPSYYHGLSNVRAFYIDGSGAENFDISADGTIRVAQEANISTQASPYRLSLYAENDYGRSESRLATINVIPVQIVDNNVTIEYRISLYDFSANLYATANANTVVGKISYSYAYALPSAFSLSGVGNERFNISSNGVITLKDNTSLKAGDIFNLEANASNEYVSSAKSQVKITVIEDAPKLSAFNVSIIDKLESQTAIGKVGYSYGVLPIVSFALEGADAAAFAIDNSGTIRIKEGAVIDYDAKNSYSFTIKAANSIGKTAQSSALVRVIDDAPTLGASSFSIMENVYGGEYIGRVSIVSNGRSVIASFTLSGEGAELFTIDNSGHIRTAAGAIIDYETRKVYNLKATATNAHDTSKETSVTINVTNAPDQEPILIATTLSVDENSPAGTYAGDMGIFAQGYSAITSFTITGTNADWFAIDKSGKVVTTEAAKLDYESKKSFALKVKAISDYGESALVDLTINVNNVPDLPPVVSAASFYIYIDENSPTNTFVGKLTINDNGSPITSATLSGTGSENFKVDNNGTIVVAEGANLDYESLDRNKRYWLSAKAVNAFGESNAVSVYIQLKNMPDTPPVLQDTYFDICRSTPADRTVGNIKASATADCGITGYILDNSSVFDVRTNGEIYTKTAVTKDSSYIISVYAKSLCGDSNTINLTIDTQSRIIGQIATGSYARSVALSSDNTKAFVGAYSRGGLKIIDISDPFSPALIGQIATGGDAYDIALSSDNAKAFVADYRYSSGDLKIIDIRDPANPALIGQSATSGYAESVALSSDNTKAFVGAYGGLYIINIRDPANPALIGQITTVSAYDIALSSDNTKAFVVDNGGLTIIDISDPTNPTIISWIITDGYAQSVALSSDNTKALVAHFGSLVIIDISDPAKPILIGQIAMSGTAKSVALSSDNTKAFVGTNVDLKIIDISDPANPALIGQIAIGSAYDVALSSDNTKAFVANYYPSGLYIIDIEDF
jgi:hypothetical protein